MSVLQKRAWYNLAVVVGSLAVTLVLIPVLGRGAQGGFGLLGLLGISPWLFRRRGKVESDERDALIRRRAVIVAYSVFWLVFVACCSLLPVFYGWEGRVPVSLVQSSVFVAMMLVVAVDALATLAQYGPGGADAV